MDLEQLLNELKQFNLDENIIHKMYDEIINYENINSEIILNLLEKYEIDKDIFSYICNIEYNERLFEEIINRFNYIDFDKINKLYNSTGVKIDIIDNLYKYINRNVIKPQITEIEPKHTFVDNKVIINGREQKLFHSGKHNEYFGGEYFSFRGIAGRRLKIGKAIGYENLYINNITCKNCISNDRILFKVDDKGKIIHEIVLNEKPIYNKIIFPIMFDKNNEKFVKLKNGYIKRTGKLSIGVIGYDMIYPAYAIDNDGNKINIEINIINIDNKLFLVKEVNREWLDNAKYPVIIDYTWGDFDTTAEWDSGTKSVSDGNYTFETITDNTRILSDCIELGNGLSDVFSITDIDSDTWKEYLNPMGNDNGTRGTDIDNTYIDELYQYAGSASDVGGTDVGFNDILDIGSDFDVQAKLNIRSGWSNNSQATLLVRVNSNTYVAVYRAYVSGNNRILSIIISGGSVKASSVIANYDSILYFRLMKDSLTYYCMYKANIEDDWSTLSSWKGTISGTAKAYVSLASYGTNHKVEVTWDYLQIVSGTIIGSHYQMSGLWSSSIQTMPANSRVGSWYVGCSNGDASNYINLVFKVGGVEKARKNNIQSNTTISSDLDLTSGSLLDLNADFTFELEGVGDGTKSISITNCYGNAVSIGTPGIVQYYGGFLPIFV